MAAHCTPVACVYECPQSDGGLHTSCDLRHTLEVSVHSWVGLGAVGRKIFPVSGSGLYLCLLAGLGFFVCLFVFVFEWNLGSPAGLESPPGHNQACLDSDTSVIITVMNVLMSD